MATQSFSFRLAPATLLASSHLLLYSALLGTELYQSFVMTKVCFKALPLSAFMTLQKRVFPVYFLGQSSLIFLTVLSHPPFGPLSLVKSIGDLLPLTIAGATALLNLIKYGPATQQAMIDRTHQETRDRRRYNDPTTKSEEMKVKNRTFSRNHAMSIHINLITIGATIWYGVRLGSRLTVAVA